MIDVQDQLVQKKIRQLVFLHASHVFENNGKIGVNQFAEYNRLYADWQAGHITLNEIQEDINEYLVMRKI
jgi:hypothetical protein